MPLTNLWPQPSIETTHDWVASSGSDAPVASTTRAYIGTKSLYCKRNAGTSVIYGADNGFQTYLSGAGLGAGTFRLSLRIWIPSTVGGTSHGIRISGTGTSLQDVSTALRNQWVELSTTLAWDGVGTLNLSARGDAATAECYIDAIILTAGSEYVPYFDGSTAMDALYRYAWTGTANASSSTRVDRAAVVKVEIAFNAGYRTPAASRVWTDVTPFVDQDDDFSVTYGRQDELSLADANGLANLVLDNTDGRFTWGNASSPYYPNIRVGRPVRVTVAAPFSSTRYLGFIEGWPVSWPGGSDSRAVVTVSAQSRIARLGRSQKLKSVVEQEILRDAPAAYYKLNQAEGATQASDASGANNEPLVPYGAGTLPPAFGQGTPLPTTDQATPLFVHTGQSLRADGLPVLAAPSTLTLEAYFAGPSNFGQVAQAGGLSLVQTGGTISASWNGAFIVNSLGSTYGDNQPHHIAATFTSSGGTDSLELFVDGVSQGTASAATSAGAPTYLIIGETIDGTISNVAIYDHVLSPARIADHAAAGLTGWAGETTDQRLGRYAAWASIPAGEVTTTSSPIEVAHIPSDDQTVLDLMRKVETTEAGVLHDGRDGKLTLRNRDARYQEPVSVTLDAASQDVGVDFEPQVDRHGMCNVAEARNLDGSVTATYTDQASLEEYGEHSTSIETAAADPGEPFQLAAWAVNANSEPRPRVPAVTVSMNGLDTATMQAVAGLDVGSMIEITNLPDQSPGGSTRFFVEGYTERYAPGVWSITFNLSPSAPYDQVFIFDDPVRGVLDSGFVLGL